MNLDASTDAVSRAAADLIATHRGLFDKMRTVAEDLNRLHEYIEKDKPTDALTEEDRCFVAEIRTKRDERKKISARNMSREEQQRRLALEQFLAAVEADSLAHTGDEPAAFRKEVAGAVAHRMKPIARRHLPVLIVTPYFVLFALVEQTIRAPQPQSDLSFAVRKYLARAGLETDACHQAFSTYISNLTGRTTN